MSCGETALLIKRTVIVQHAYPKRLPRGWALCPYDRNVFAIADVKKTKAKCTCCGRFIPLQPKRTGRFECISCEEEILPEPDLPSWPPEPVLVAVEVRNGDGERAFRRPSKTEITLATGEDSPKLTRSPIDPGLTTEQILRWGYADWADLLHPRQRVLASAISRRVARVEDEELREQLALAFSPFFEYHCRLASFKGLGTGSVRQALGQPILHPVSVSYEVNPVAGNGKTRVSGDPRSWYDLRTKRSKQAFEELTKERGSAIKMGTVKQAVSGSAQLAILHSDSRTASIPAGSVDAVVTDPPYFDRVHYDDLAGPLNAWLCWCRSGGANNGTGIQAGNREVFRKGLQACFGTSCKALKPGGRLLFTYHHHDENAWIALATALKSLPVVGDDLLLVPGEMPNALVKQRALTPISHDAVLCFTKGQRQTGPGALVSRSIRLARKVIRESNELLKGDRINAAYAAATVVYLRVRGGHPDLRKLFAEVRSELKV